MTREELNARINAAEEKIAKKHTAIEKHEKAIEKRRDIIAAAGFERTAEFKDIPYAPENMDARLASLEIEHLFNDIDTARETIKTTEATIAKYREAIAKADADAEIVLPSVLEIMEAGLVESWDRWDAERVAFLRTKKAEMDRRDFYKMYGTETDILAMTAEQRHANNVRDAHAMVLNLAKRVSAKVGTITNWNGLSSVMGAYGPTLNGFVEGTDGRAIVETITAGGWNIQRFHVRTIIK